MRDPFFVRRREAARDLQRILSRLANGDRATPRPLSKRLAFEQLGHDERRTAISADVVHREDVRVVQRRGRAGFLLESMEAIDVGRECAGQYLDRNVTPEPRIARAIDLAHAAHSDLGGDLIRAEARSRGQGQV